jgi:hypothetical protein
MRQELSGMLPGSIVKFEALLVAVPGSAVTRGYSGTGGDDDLRTWGVVCDISGDTEALKSAAAVLGIESFGGDTYAFTNGLSLADFKTYRVNGSLELMPEEER